MANTSKSAADVETHPMALYGEQFVHAWNGHGDTIGAITNRGRIFLRMRDRRETGHRPVMRWYEAKAPDFTAEFEPHLP